MDKFWQFVVFDGKECVAEPPRGTLEEALCKYDAYERKEGDVELFLSEYKALPDGTCEHIRDFKQDNGHIQDTVLIKELGEALRIAHEHLEFCGYGDSYEREAAVMDNVPDIVNKAVDQYNKWEE